MVDLAGRCLSGDLQRAIRHVADMDERTHRRPAAMQLECFPDQEEKNRPGNDSV